MTVKISGLLLLVVAVTALLLGNQWIALAPAVVGGLFLLYSSAGSNRRTLRRDSDFSVADGGTIGSGDNGCDIDSSSADGGCGDGGGGGCD
jgi:hypothetical protein